MPESISPESISPEAIHSGLEHSGLEHSGLEHSGLEHSGLEHSGLEGDGLEDAPNSDAPKPARARGLLPQALEELQLSVEELRVADEEMRVQNEELSRGRLRLEAERLRYQDLFDFAPDGYLVTTLDGTILEANQAASRMLGISTRFLKNRSLGTLVAVPDLADFQPRLKALTASGGSALAEWIVQMRRRPNGKFTAAVTAARFQGRSRRRPDPALADSRHLRAA